MTGTYSQATLEAHFTAIGRRLERIEAQLELLSRTAGVPYASYAESLEIPEDVIALAGDGKRLEAVKRYRELTGANMDQAREAVAGL